MSDHYLAHLEGDMNPKIVYVRVKLELKANADVEDVISEMDYKFDHPDILETEIIESEEV